MLLFTPFTVTSFLFTSSENTPPSTSGELITPICLYLLFKFLQNPLFHPGHLDLGNSHLCRNLRLRHILKISHTDQLTFSCIQFFQDFIQKNPVQCCILSIFFFLEPVHKRNEGKGIDVKQLIDLCETMPFFAERRVVLLEDTGFFKNKCEELADYMKELPDYLYLVFAETEVDKRNRMYKAVKACGSIAEFIRQDEKTLMRWAAGILGKAGKKITQRDMELLLTKTGTDMGNLRMEMEKLISYTEGRDVVTAEDIEEICTTQTTNRIFDMVRAVTEKNQKRALELYYDLLTLKEPPMRILFLLAKQYRQLLLAKQFAAAGLAQTEIGSKLGVPGFVVKNITTCARAYTISELEQAVKDFVDAEESVKTGRLEDKLSVELLIIKYSSKVK